MIHDEIIAIVEHHKNGGEVEYKNHRSDVWVDMRSPHLFNFEIFDYRIKEKPKTKTVWFWRIRFGNRWVTTGEMCTEDGIKETYPDLEYKRLDILGSEEVPND